jgi:hypothetical protein
MSITGSCFCGAVTYLVGERLIDARACHCSRCRKAFSGASSAYAVVQGNSHSWTSGERTLKHYKSDSGWELVFCSECGSTLAGVFEGTVHGVTLGTLNEDPNLKIERHLYVGSKASWDHIGGSAPQYSEGAID